MAKHTPGPWTYDEELEEVRSGEGAIADLMFSDNTSETNLANGVLMMAAPDLLAALRAASEVLVQDDCPMIYAQVQKALALAEGRTT